MKKILVLITFVFVGTIIAQNNNQLQQKQIDKQIEQEKKYAKEQKFYQGDQYDLKSREVNPDSLKNLKVPEIDDLDMDDVYN